MIEWARSSHTHSRPETKIVAFANPRAFGDAPRPMQRRVVALVVAVKFTGWYPDAYLERKQRLAGQAPA